MQESKVLEFWQAVEALTPQDAFRVNSSDLANPVYGVNSDSFAKFPWENEKHLGKPIDQDSVWVYEAQCGVHEAHELGLCVLKAMGNVRTHDDENRGGTSRVFDIRFDASGMPLPQSFSLSLSAWASGQLIAHGGDVEALLAGGTWSETQLPEPGSDAACPQSGFDVFDRVSMGLVQWIADEVAQFVEAGTRPTVAWLRELVDLVAGVAHLPLELFDSRAFVRIRGSRVRAKNANEKGQFVEGLGSFYASDLKMIAAAIKRGDIGDGMRQFMSAGQSTVAPSRVDVRDSANNPYLAKALSPSRMPRGRWPSDHALAFSQQLAVNEVFAELGNGAGIFAVNGPPGTGKTTLLRDVVASVVVRRAMVLIELGDKAFGAKSVVKLGDTAVPFYPLNPKLHGFSIVVSSAGNGAVENVTRELPGIEAVPTRVAAQKTYFPEIAKAVSGKDAWGLIAAPLGNRRNRTDFVSRFWWGEKATATKSAVPAMRDHLKHQLGDAAAGTRWVNAVAKFKMAVKVESAQRKRVEACAALPGRIADSTLQIQATKVTKAGLDRDLAHSAKELFRRSRAQQYAFGVR